MPRQLRPRKGAASTRDIDANADDDEEETHIVSDNFEDDDDDDESYEYSQDDSGGRNRKQRKAAKQPRRRTTANATRKRKRHKANSPSDQTSKETVPEPSNDSSESDHASGSNQGDGQDSEEEEEEEAPDAKVVSNTALHAQLLAPSASACRNSSEGGGLLFDDLALKADHARRPLWVLPTGQILLESFSRFYSEACDFLVTIAEPVSRPTFIHEYKLTPYSLYAAVSTDIGTEAIVQVLDKLSKVSLPPNIVRFIRECTASYGKAKLVLKKGHTYVESPHVDVLQLLLNAPEIGAARVDGDSGGGGGNTHGVSVSVPPMEGSRDASGFIVSEFAEGKTDNIHRYVALNLEDDEEDQEDKEQELEDINDMRRLSRTTSDGRDGAKDDAGDTSRHGRESDDDDDDQSDEEGRLLAKSKRMRRGGGGGAGMTKQQMEWERLRRREQQDVERAAREWGALVKASQSDPQPTTPQVGTTSGGSAAATHDHQQVDVTGSPQHQQEVNTAAVVASAPQPASTTHGPSQPERSNDNINTTTAANQQNSDNNKSKKKKQAYSFQVRQESVEDVRRTALEMDYPLMEEYDFRRDTVNLPIPIELKPSTHIRSYQARSLSKMFGNGRARSGVIVLPCGAGKTLTGITACATISRSTVVLCNSGVAAQQWRTQLLQFTSIPTDRIARFTSKHKDHIHKDGCVLLTTYHMMAKSGRRSASARAALRVIQAREWGLLILDEVHIAPARLFRQVLMSMKAHCKLGLTATLVREDEKIFDLNFLIGPKLYEANWLDLTDQGYLARVRCREVFCPMPSEFYAEYLQWNDHHHLQQLLYVLNPNKIIAVEHLVQQHDARGDKTLVFCDNVLALRTYQHRLRCPLIFGGTSENDRIRLLNQFRRSSVSNTLLISKVGDVALDLPEANVLIQVSSHYGSRRQEAQRLGRILRRKAGSQYRGGFNAFFYSLVSTDTSEMYYSGKRQQYLVDQGYYFEAVKNIGEIAAAVAASDGGRATTTATAARGHCASLRNRDEQLKLLREILTSYSGRAAERDKQRQAQHEAKLRREEIAAAKAAFVSLVDANDMDDDDDDDNDDMQVDQEELAERWIAEEMEGGAEATQAEKVAPAAAAVAAQAQTQTAQQRASEVRERERARVVSLRERMTMGNAMGAAAAAAGGDGGGDGGETTELAAVIDEDELRRQRRTGGVAKAKRTVTSSASGMAALSGVGDLEYLEYSADDE